MTEEYTIALAGNPNCGKTTLFNQLTGSRQHVGNWPGKTVEKKEGTFQYNGMTITVVDLPGTYSLTAFSLEEIIARDFIINEKPDAVISVVDSNNLERNLYLTLQVLELGVPVVVALNMCDMADSHGVGIDDVKLGEGLRSEIVRTVAREGKGIDKLKDAIDKTIRSTNHGRA